ISEPSVPVETDGRGKQNGKRTRRLRRDLQVILVPPHLRCEVLKDCEIFPEMGDHRQRGGKVPKIATAIEHLSGNQRWKLMRAWIHVAETVDDELVECANQGDELRSESE